MLRRQKRYVKQSRDELRKQTRIMAGEDPDRLARPKMTAAADAVRFGRDHPRVAAVIAAAVVGLMILGAVTGGSSTVGTAASTTTGRSAPVGTARSESAALAAACQQLRGITGSSSSDASALASAATTLWAYRNNNMYSDPGATLLASVILDQRAGTYNPAGIDSQCASVATAAPASSAQALGSRQSQPQASDPLTAVPAPTTTSTGVTVPAVSPSAPAPSDTTTPSTVAKTPVPDVVGYQGNEVGPLMTGAGLRPVWAGTPNQLCNVTATSPPPGTPVQAGTTVTVTCAGGEVADYTGGSCALEAGYAQGYALMVAWNGPYNPSWYVTAQDPPPGAAAIPAGSTLTLTCGSSTEPSVP